MAKDRSEKKEKKEKRKSVDGVKKEKKEKRKSTDATTALLDTVEDAALDAVEVDADGDVVVDVDDTVVASEVPMGPLVPFANPLCDDKAGKKVLKAVKKGMSFYLLPAAYNGHCVSIC